MNPWAPEWLVLAASAVSPLAIAAQAAAPWVPEWFAMAASVSVAIVAAVLVWLAARGR